MSETDTDDVLPPQGPDEELADATGLMVDDLPASDDQHDGTRSAYVGWAYLIFLFAVFFALALIAYACDDETDSGDATGDATTTTQPATVALTPVVLEFEVAGDQVTLRGSVPSDDVKDELVEMAQGLYEDGTVVDELVVDDGTTLTEGTVSITGTTLTVDARPDDLERNALSVFSDLTIETFTVVYEEVELVPIEVEVQVTTDQIALIGVVPDQATVDAMVAAAEEIWGAGNVDGSGLTVDPTYSLIEGTVQVTGVTDAGDTRVGEFTVVAVEAFGVSVDNTVDVDTSAEALARLEERLRETLVANPILFATGSAEIDPASDAILEETAAAIIATPGIAVEIVGHTDDQGDADTNQELSEERAQAVLDRLVELGVEADRLTARGAGEEEPIADNDTAEGRAANRRTVFEFEGAADGEG